MKKSLSLLLAIAMVISMFAGSVFAAEGTSGEQLEKYGIIKGTSNGLDEDKEWKRKDVTVLLARLYQEVDKAEATAAGTKFADLGEDKFYQSYITWAVEKELFNGKSETTFAPNDSIKNVEFATVILRALGKDNKEDYTKNLDIAIELGLFPAGTDAEASAVRGATYTAVVKALDVVVEGGKKFGNKLGLADYAITELEIVKASAVVGKTITVEFNDAVKEIKTVDVVITDADGNVIPHEKVAIEGKVATITLPSELAQKAHTIKIAQATSVAGSVVSNLSQDFTYTKGIAASIAFVTTKVAVGSEVKYVVKDANGQDITGDFGTDKVTVSSTQTEVVGADLAAKQSGMSQVTVKINDNNEITTGDVVINVVDALDIKISDIKFKNDVKNPIHLGSNNATATAFLQFVVKNQDDKNVSPKTSGDLEDKGYTVKFSSNNPTVASVTNVSYVGVGDHGKVSAFKAGTATITITVEYGGVKKVASYDVVVKEQAKATSFELDKTNVTVVNNEYRLPQNIVVTVKDQFNETYKASDLDGKIEVASAGRLDIVDTFVTDDGKYTIVVRAVEGANTGSVQLKVTLKDGEKSIGTKTAYAAIVKQGTSLTGYDVAFSGTTVDTKQATGDFDKEKKDAEINVNIYVKDNNGNRVYEIAPEAYTNGLLEITFDNDIIAYNNATKKIAVAAGKDGKTGTVKAEIKYNKVLIATRNISVVATHQDIIKSISVEKASVEVKEGDEFTLVGTYDDNDDVKDLDAFKAWNAYSKQVADATVTVSEAISSNESAVTFAGSNKFIAHNEGSAQLTVKINGELKVITVVVKAGNKK